MNKTIIGLIIAGILLISIPIGVRLVQQQQILKSRAEELSIDSLLCSADPGIGDPPIEYDSAGVAIAACPANPKENFFYWDEHTKFLSDPAAGTCTGNETPRCVRKSDCAVWNGEGEDGLAHWVYYLADPSKCGKTVVATPTPGGGNCLDKTPAPGGNPGNCPGVNWAAIWKEMRDIDYGWGNDKCDGATVLAKFLALGNNAARCSGGGGGVCSVTNWRFSYQNLTNNFPVNTLIRAAVQGVSDPGEWQNLVYKRETDTAWVKPPFTISGTTFSFDVDSGSPGTHTVTFGVNNGTSACSPIGSFTTGGAAGGPSPVPAEVCPYTPTEVMFNTPDDREWRNQNVTISKNGNVTVAGFHNRDTGVTPPANVVLSYNGPDGTSGINLENPKQFTPSRVGRYTFTAQTKDASGNLYSGSGCTNSSSFTVSAAAPTFTPAPSTPSPTPTACKAQVRLSADGNQPWNTSLPITLGASVYLAGFDGDQTEAASADITDIQIKGPSNSPTVSSHTVTLPVSAKNEKNIFSYTIPANDGAGTYIITVRRNGVDCTGKATLTVTAPVATTARYRVSENKADFTLADSAIAPWAKYESDGLLANYTIRDRNPGQKLIYVEFEDSNGFRGGCGSNNKPTTSTKLEDKKYPCMMPIKYLDSGRISNCSISIDGSNTILNLTGDNFGTAPGNVKGTIIAGSTEGTGLTPISWEDNLVSVKWSNAPQGKTLYVTLTTANKQKMPGTCSPVSQLALSTKVFCQAISTTNCAKDNVNLVIKDVASGDIVVNKTVSINTDGVVTGLNQKLEAGKKYILSIKAPKSLRRNREFTVTTATGGTTNISDFVLPLGDINTLGGKGDGKIAGSDYALMVRDWNISTDTGDRAGDVDCNRRVNSRDWACLVYDYGKESDPELVPGVTLTDPNATPLPGTTVTPAPGQPGACTLGMYVRFEGINNAAFSAHPVVSLGLYPPGATIRPGTIPPAEPLGYNLSSGTVSVTSSTNPAHQQDVFLITSGTKQLTCGESYDVVVMSSGYKLSRFRGVKVVNNPSLYPTFFLNNEPICLKTAGGCNYKCLENDPCCPFTTGSAIPANNCVIQ